MTLPDDTPSTIPDDVREVIRLGRPDIATDTLARRLKISIKDAERRIEDWYWATSRLSRGSRSLHKTRG